MANCKNTKFTGAVCALEYVIGCGDELPTTGWKRLGAMTTKELTIEWDTTDGTTDDSVGALRENIATFQSISVSGDGKLKASGGGSAAIIEMTKHVAKPIGTAGQPVAWIRLTFPDLTFTFFAIVSNMSRSAPSDDLATYSFEASATASDFGLIVEDTPDPDAIEVAVSPATLSVEVGDTETLSASVTPSNVPQSVQWSSSAPAIATVHPTTGVVTGVAAGTATITATSVANNAKSGTAAVTVTA